MKTLKTILLSIVAFAVFAYTLIASSENRTHEVVPAIVHLVGHQDTFVGEDKITHLEAGDYYFVVSNKTPDLMVLAIQDISSNEDLDAFTLEPNETHIAFIRIGEHGARVKNSNTLATWQALNSH